MNFVISEFSLSDLPEIKTLLHNESLPESGLDEIQPEFFLHIREHNRIIACAAMEIYGTYGLLRSVVVDPQWRNTGLAKILVDRLELHAIEKGTSFIYLLTTTADDYFARLGYERIQRDDVAEEIKQTQEFEFLCPSSSVCMRKSL